MSNLVDGGMGFTHKPNWSTPSLDDKIDRTAVEAARRKFTPEFMNRIDKLWYSIRAARASGRDPRHRTRHGDSAF